MKKIGILIAALAVLLLIYVLLESGEPVVKAGQPFVEADSASIIGLTIISAGDNVSLTKKDESWVVTGDREYPANATNVGRALQRFDQMNRQAMVTSRHERFNEFQLDDSAAVRVTYRTNGDSRTILLGKAGPSMQTMYARLDGSNEVWEISGNHTSTFKRSLNDWRDKTITKLNMEDVTRLEFRYPTETIVASKSDTIWQVTSGTTQFESQKSLVERVTRLLSSMNAVDFIATLGETTFENPELNLIATINTGETIDLKLAKKDDKQYFLRKSGAISDYVIYTSTATALMKKVKDFQPQEDEKK